MKSDYFYTDDSADCCVDVASIRVGAVDRTGIVTSIPAAVDKEIGPQGG